MNNSSFYFNTTSNIFDVFPLETEYHLFIKDISSFFILICLSFVGTIGNIHVLCVYMLQVKQSCLRIIVISLAIVDLFACAFLISHDVIDIRYNVSISSAIRCEFFLYFDYLCTLSSISMLALLALERYRLICKPLKRQPNTKESKIVCSVTVLVCAIIAIPCFVFYDTPRIDFNHSGATNCVDVGTTEKILHFQIYSAFIVIFTSILLVLCIIVYVLLAVSLTRIKRNLSALRKALPKLPVTMIHSLSDHHSQVRGVSFSVTGESNKNIYSDDFVAVKQKEMKKRQKLFESSLRSVLTFSVSTMISYLCWLVTIVTISGTIFGLDIESYLGQGFTVVIHIFYLNHVINPVVYFLLYPTFRQNCKELYYRLFRYVRRTRHKIVTFSSNV